MRFGVHSPELKKIHNRCLMDDIIQILHMAYIKQFFEGIQDLAVQPWSTCFKSTKEPRMVSNS